MKARSINVITAQTPEEQTGTSFIIPSTEKDRIIFTYRGANTLLCKKDIPEELFHQIEGLYITSLTDKAADILPHITHLAQTSITQGRFKVAVNPGSSQLTNKVDTLKASLAYIDVLILNSSEMKTYMEESQDRFFKSSGSGLIKDGPPLARTVISHNKISFTLHEYCKEILSYGVKRVVVTDGKNGVYVALKDTLFYHPSLTTEVVNTLGAGDAFGSCFFGSLLHGNSVEQSIRNGIINASSVIMYHDAKSGLLDQEDLKKYNSSFDAALLESYSW